MLDSTHCREPKQYFDILPMNFEYDPYTNIAMDFSQALGPI
jgi:hypothetical protein